MVSSCFLTLTDLTGKLATFFKNLAAIKNERLTDDARQNGPASPKNYLTWKINSHIITPLSIMLSLWPILGWESGKCWSWVKYVNSLWVSGFPWNFAQTFMLPRGWIQQIYGFFFSSIIRMICVLFFFFSVFSFQPLTVRNADVQRKQI